MAVTKQKVDRMHNEVRDNYRNAVQKEFLRTNKDLKGYLEFYTTMHYLRKHLPRGGLVLDAGSGPGRYTLELARMGYNVVALDPVEESLKFLERRARRLGLSGRIKSTVVGRLEDLGVFDSNEFDAIICIGGPLSHVMDPALRKRSVSELLRVAKKGAPLFVGVMCRLASLKGFLNIFPHEVTTRYVKSYLETGDYLWPHLYGFTHFHGFTPQELSAAFKGPRFRQLALVGLEGAGSYEKDSLKRLHRHKARWNAWLRYHIMLAEQPSIIGSSEHILLVGKKV